MVICVNIQGVQLHLQCGGLGIIESDGKGEICVECMGTGMIEGETDIDE
jgi:hypothetical protein